MATQITEQARSSLDSPQRTIDEARDLNSQRASSLLETEINDGIEQGDAVAEQRRAEVTTDELRVLCDATVRLTELRQRECGHLCVENFAPKVLHALLTRLTMFKRGMMRAIDLEDRS